MNKPAFLVEGVLEQKFIQNTCSTSAVQKINCNGDAVAISSIAKRVGTLGRLLQKRCSVIVVIFDREQRIETPEEIENQFRQALSNEELQVPVIVGIPDREIENWILSDAEMFAQSAGLDVLNISTEVEGIKGKSLIKQLLGKGRSYVETIDGVAWLKSSRPEVMKKASPSFAKFADALAKMQCWWLSQDYLSNQGE